MTVLITSDLHLNDLNRDQYRHNFIRNILPQILRNHKVVLLLILGDLCDDKDHHGAWLVNTIVDHLIEITSICPTVILRGNHDYVQTDCSFYEFLGKIPRISWISEPMHAEEVLIDDRVYANKILGDTLFLPHTSNYKRDWSCLINHDLYFTHQTYQGAKVGPRTMEGIPTDIFLKESLVISGDIHEPQAFDNVVYCGSPYLEDFGDDFEPRLLVLDPAALTVKSIPSPGPQKRLIEVNSVAELKQQRMCNKGDILKVRVRLNAADHAQWLTIQDQVRAWGAKEGFTIYLVQPVVDAKGTSGSAKSRKANTRTDEELLGIYSKSRAVSETTLKTGLNLLRKV